LIELPFDTTDPKLDAIEMYYMSDMVNQWGNPIDLDKVNNSINNLDILCQIVDLEDDDSYKIVWTNASSNMQFLQADSVFIFLESQSEIRDIIDEIKNVNQSEQINADYFDTFAIDFIDEKYISSTPLPVAFGEWYEYNVTAVVNNNLLFIFLVTYNETDPFWNIGLSISLVLAFIMLLSFFTRKYLRPVTLMKNRIVDLESGDLKTRIPIIGNDELSELSKYMNKLIKNIKILLDQKQALLSDVSHELRSPLARMKLLVEMMPKHKNIIQLKYEIDFLEELISNLLLSDRLSTPYAKLDLELITVESIIKELKQIFKNNIDLLQFNIMTAEDLKLTADKTKLIIAIKNIISNAIKYNRDNNKINLEINNTKSNIVFTITDQGIGFEEKNVKNILEPFYRLDMDSDQKGFGLGLTICNKIINAHSGSIKISSQLGKGSKFRLLVPINKENHE
tara:strand:- start:472 stop:1827 length:1356 start_codon:yes stop_codon:yes gene_type:complete